MSYIKDSVYTKIRKNFGRQTLFQSTPGQLLDTIPSDRAMYRQYMLRNPVNRQIQATLSQSEHFTNTPHVQTEEDGVEHVEGGWPKEILPYSEDQTSRHRRRIHHEENYINSVLSLSKQMEHYIEQNNAIEMYETYFTGMKTQNPVENYNIRVANVFKDPLERQVSCMKWTDEKQPRLVVAYCDRQYLNRNDKKLSNACYFWDVNIQNEPVAKFYPSKPCWEFACSPGNPDHIIAGLENGTVHIFDVKASKTSVAETSIYNSHHGPITGLLYLSSRTNTEFFTGALDGQCLWWDLRDISTPIDQLSMTLKVSKGNEPCLTNSEGVSALEFNKGLSTKFLCGTESGYVINVNRSGRSHAEMMSCVWLAQTGPVRCAQRSPCTLRMFLTCGDWSVRVWSEEARTAPIIVTRPYSSQVTDASWTPLRLSSYVVVDAGGVFYYWDFLRNTKDPVATLQISKNALQKLCVQPEGEWVIMGDNKGSSFLVSLPESMVLSGPNDKQLMNQLYTRETKREHNLDSRVKELRLKAKVEEQAVLAAAEQVEEIEEEEDDLKVAEEEYFHKVHDELKKLDLYASSTSLRQV